MALSTQASEFVRQLYELLLEQQAQRIAEQHLLLEEQRDLLRTMLGNKDNPEK